MEPANAHTVILTFCTQRVRIQSSLASSLASHISMITHTNAHQSISVLYKLHIDIGVNFLVCNGFTLVEERQIY